MRELAQCYPSERPLRVLHALTLCPAMELKVFNFGFQGFLQGPYSFDYGCRGRRGGCLDKAPYNIEVHSGSPKELYWCCNYSDLVLGV